MLDTDTAPEAFAPEDKPWDLGQTAEFLGECDKTTRKRVARGELPAIRLPNSRRLLFNPATVRSFVKANER
jgi:hypothetical protein